MSVKAFVLDDDLRLRRLITDALREVGVVVVDDVVDADVLVVRAIARLTRYHVYAKLYDEGRELLQAKGKRLPIVGYTDLSPADVPSDLSRRIKGGTSEMFFGPLRPSEVATAVKAVGERRLARTRRPSSPRGSGPARAASGSQERVSPQSRPPRQG